MTPDRNRPKLLRNAVGRKVRTLRELRNGNMVVPADTVVTVTSGTGWERLNIRAPACPGCGVAVLMSRVSVRDVAFLSVMKGDEE